MKASPLSRHPANPILVPAQMPFECSAVFNCGAVRFRDRVLLLLRSENLERQTEFYVATSEDGLTFDVSAEQIKYPMRAIEKQYGAHRFDMRVTPIEGTFYCYHASWINPFGCCIGLAQTDDFVNFRPVGELSVPSNRNAVLFPRKIGGRYARLERPQNVDGSGRMWINFSPDLLYWGEARPLEVPVAAWGTRKNGAGAIPIETPEGWLCIYHATAMTASTENYYLGAMLLDREDPSKVIAAPKKFILQPEMAYECVGQVPNVVFTGGAVEMPDGKLNVYYGGADTRVCLAQTTVRRMVEFCLSAAAATKK